MDVQLGIFGGVSWDKFCTSRRLSMSWRSVFMVVETNCWLCRPPIVSVNEYYPSNIGALAGRKGKSWQEREEAFRKGVSGSGVW